MMRELGNITASVLLPQQNQWSTLGLAEVPASAALAAFKHISMNASRLLFHLGGFLGCFLLSKLLLFLKLLQGILGKGLESESMVVTTI